MLDELHERERVLERELLAVRLQDPDFSDLRNPEDCGIGTVVGVLNCTPERARALLKSGEITGHRGARRWHVERHAIDAYRRRARMYLFQREPE